MADKTLDTLFHDTLKDVYYAERQILKALPKMRRGAQAACEAGEGHRAAGRRRRVGAAVATALPG